MAEHDEQDFASEQANQTENVDGGEDLHAVGETQAIASDVTEERLREYGGVDEEAVKRIRSEWREKKKIKRLMPINTALMLGVLAFVPWYAYHERLDIAYFFSSSTPVDLGSADAYRLVDGEPSKPQDFPDNRYVRMTGIPIRHVGIESRDGLFSFSRTGKIVYELMGSSVYVQELAKDSKFASFMSKTSSTFRLDQDLEPIEVTGRLRRFDTADAKQYAPVREYYTEKFGIMFCKDMSDADRQRKARLLGHGGVALQIMPDDSIIEGDTDTHATLKKVIPLRGRSAMALGQNNTLLHTIDAGLSWRKTEIKGTANPLTVAFEPTNETILFGGKQGWIGGEDTVINPEDLQLTQDVEALAFTQPEPGDVTSPRIIAAGREGLLQVAYPDREGWTMANIDDAIGFNDILRVGGTVFVAGSKNMLMQRDLTDNRDAPWISAVSPVQAEWMSLTQIPGYVVATGSHGAVARYDFSASLWETWPADDVPGIDFDENIRSSAVSDDGKTWVGVGDHGSILTAKAGEDGKFGRIERISGSYAGYGVVRDILAGNPIEASLYEAVQRATDEDLYDIVYHHGTFYAVGAESLVMTSHDGLSWHKRTLHVPHKVLRTIAFTPSNVGVIAGEKGIMFVTADDGATWRGKASPTERSIYQVRTSPSFPNGFLFSGAYGLWGYCLTDDDKCYRRSKNDDYIYRSIEFDQGEQKNGYLKVLLAGDDFHIDKVDDAPGNASNKYSICSPGRSRVYAMALTDEELPLKPNAPRGQIDLISAGNGHMYRSYDGGYTFKREETGVENPIVRLVNTQDGTAVWGFDGKGAAIEDIDGRKLWKRLDSGHENGFLDGVFIDRTGYLIDDECVYAKELKPNAEITRLGCLSDKDVSLDSITRRGTKIVLGMHRDPAELLWTEIEPQAGMAIMAGEPLSMGIEARLIACGDQLASFDSEHHLLMNSSGEKIENIADVNCISGKLTTMRAEKLSDRTGVYKLTASSDGADIWSMNVSFDPTNAKFGRNHAGRWWVASESDGVSNPLILMSHDGKQWSWRRDRVTDYHDVAAVGSKAIAVGDEGTILVSEDSGRTWTKVKTSVKSSLRDVCMSSDGSYALAVGDNSTIYRAQNNFTSWTRVKHKLDLDLTSCTIAEQKDRFDIYISGKGGAIYKTDQSLNRLDLVSSPVGEDLYSIAALETGEVLAVGGVYQDPASICDEGFLIESDEKPSNLWTSLLLIALLGLFWLWTLKTLIVSIKHRHDFDEEDDELFEC